MHFIFVTHFLNVFCIHGKHNNAFIIVRRLNLNYNNRKLLSKGVIRE